MSLPNNNYFASPMQHLTHEPCSPTHPGWEANLKGQTLIDSLLQQLQIKWIQILRYNHNCLWLRLKDLFIPDYISLEKQLHIYTSKVNKPCNLYRSHSVALNPSRKKCHRKEHQLPGLVDVRSSRQEGQVATRIFWCPTPVMFKKNVFGMFDIDFDVSSTKMYRVSSK